MWRLTNIHDTDLILKSLNKTKDFVLNNFEGKSWFKDMDYQYILDAIIGRAVNSAIIDNNYLIVFDVSSPWFSPEVFFSELLLLRIGDGSTFSEAVKGIEEMAAHYGATSISVGTALTLNDTPLVRLYSKHGFKPACVQLHRKV